jgi:phospholipase C
MSLKHVTQLAAGCLRTTAVVAAVWQMSFGGALQAQEAALPPTASPIQHVIVIIGENRTFDHLFATYQPKPGQTVDNLLSKKIVKADGSPGANFLSAAQFSADVTNSPIYQPSPSNKKPYTVLPAPLAGGPTNICVDIKLCTLAGATSSEDGLAHEYYPFMLTGGTNLVSRTPDTRITGVHASAPFSTLPSGPFQLTNSLNRDTFPYDSYSNSPVHRFYEMWQQVDCNAAYATPKNPSGCLNDLFPWVEVTVGSNNNGQPQPPNFSPDYGPNVVTTGEGATSMGFYNMQQGDAPYTKFLADTYAMSDNFHQSVMGGTGANHIMLGFADAIWFSDGNGNPTKPPENAKIWAGGPVQEIENPNPQPGTNNFWIQDGYGGFGNVGNSKNVYGGGSYSNCSDSTAPGVGPIVKYLASLKTPIQPNCDQGHYYLLNNYNPGYFGDGSNAFLNHNPANTPFTIPPTQQSTIADVLTAAGVSWAYYGDQWDAYLTDPYQKNFGKVGPDSDQYCNICNPFQYSTNIMKNPTLRANLQDTKDLYAAIKNGTLPAVSYVKPSGWVDGHPASSKWNLYEGFVKKIVDTMQENPSLWSTTAIFVTADEGGGYYDSGYIQPLDFFGDGTRIPLIAISPYVKPGHISHDYTDHVSIVKFIERNWKLGTVSSRSRDNYPNPKYNAQVSNYAPINSPAIGDLFDLFNFGQ